MLPQSCCYYGVGAVKLAPWGALSPAEQAQPWLSAAWRDVGEASRLDLTVRSKTSSLPRYDGCGGVQCATEKLEGIDINLGLDCLDWANLMLAFAATATDLPAEVPGLSWGYNWGGGWGWEADLANTGSLLPHGVPQTRLAMLTRCAREPMSVLFEGKNLIDGSSLWVHVPKVKFQLAQNRSFLSQDFGELQLTGMVLHAGARSTGLPSVFSPYWDEIYGT